jgi:hypothetical protein
MRYLKGDDVLYVIAGNEGSLEDRMLALVDSSSIKFNRSVKDGLSAFIANAMEPNPTLYLKMTHGNTAGGIKWQKGTYTIPNDR